MILRGRGLAAIAISPVGRLVEVPDKASQAPGLLQALVMPWFISNAESIKLTGPVGRAGL